MSTIINADTSNGLKLTSDTSGEIELQANGVTKAKITANGLQDNNGNSLRGGSYRNLIINGDMRIAQRGTSFTGLSNEYGLDRWKANLDLTGAATASQDTDVPSGQGFSYSQKVQVTTAVTYATTQQAFIEHLIEAQNISHLSYGSASAKSLTASFWVKSNVTGTFIVWFYRPDDGRSISKSYTINTANTWEKKSITVEGDISGSDIPSDNGDGFHLRFVLDAGPSFDGTLTDTWQSVPTTGRYAGQSNLYASTSNYINITGVQLEVGEGASDFEHLPYDVQLQRCQRYFQTSYVYGSTIGSSFSNGSANALQQSWASSNASSIAGGTWKLPVTMRTSGTLTVYDQAGASGKYTKLGAGGLPTNGATPNQTLNGPNQLQLRTYNNAAYGLEFAYKLDAEL